MKYCITCGVEIPDSAKVCNNCGGIQEPKNEKYAIVWLVLGCMFPVVGLLLYVIWKSTRPNSSLMAGKGALLHVGLLGMFFVMYAIIMGMLYLFL